MYIYYHYTLTFTSKICNRAFIGYERMVRLNIIFVVVLQVLFLMVVVVVVVIVVIVTVAMLVLVMRYELVDRVRVLHLLHSVGHVDNHFLPAQRNNEHYYFFRES